MGTVHTTSRPSRRKKRSGSTWNWTTPSPLPFAPWPLRRMRMPSSVPGGTVMIKRFSTRTSPAPWQVPHRVEGTRPLPRHTGHGRLTAKPPCPKEIVPRPWHSGQTEMVAPGAAVTARPGEGAVLAELIVLLPLRGVAQHVVRFVDLLEALSRLWFAGIAVRMVLLGQPSEGALDLVDGCGLRDPEDLVVVLRRSHQPRSPSVAPPPPPPAPPWPPCPVSPVTRPCRLRAPPAREPPSRTAPTASFPF